MPPIKHSMMEFAMHYFRHGRDALVRGEDGTIRVTVMGTEVGTLGKSAPKVGYIV
ncbi:hypothetical protein OS493_003029 [Desmophyllum pertusum]|uniref:Uncharacterized protein n=1 Tax=Desmophyllum pertusum TaxID=174260 RepID=A0A9X0CGD0_9CNID|nr:hypothetical protein OS493_003029 [Desmophyllum pertusum]